jgi:hypothetical protein
MKQLKAATTARPGTNASLLTPRNHLTHDFDYFLRYIMSRVYARRGPACKKAAPFLGPQFERGNWRETQEWQSEVPLTLKKRHGSLGREQ